MFKTVIAAAFACLIAFGSAQAGNTVRNGVETRPALTNTNTKLVGMPAVFGDTIGIYQDWSPEVMAEYDVRSVHNWANRARIEISEAKRNKFRDWVFSRDEATLQSLARFNAPILKQVFGNGYVNRILDVVFSKEYTADVDGMYTGWYGCVSQIEVTLSDDRKELVSEGEVLSWINYGKDRTSGENGECIEQLVGLANYYGVDDLSADHMMAIGFLHRRHVASQQDTKFVKAEVVRKIVYDIFKTE